MMFDCLTYVYILNFSNYNNIANNDDNDNNDDDHQCRINNNIGRNYNKFTKISINP